MCRSMTVKLIGKKVKNFVSAVRLRYLYGFNGQMMFWTCHLDLNTWIHRFGLSATIISKMRKHAADEFEVQRS